MIHVPQLIEQYFSSRDALLSIIGWPESPDTKLINQTKAVWSFVDSEHSVIRYADTAEEINNSSERLDIDETWMRCFYFADKYMFVPEHNSGEYYLHVFDMLKEVKK